MDRVCQLCRGLIGKGHSCTILATSLGWDRTFIANIEGLEAVSLPCISKRYMIPSGAGKWLDGNIRRFDIVHLAGNWSPINVLAYMAALKHNVPYVFSAMGALDIIGRSSFVKHMFRFLWTRPILRNANAVIAISPREYRDYMRFGVPETKISFIPNGLKIDGLDNKNDDAFRERYGLDCRKIVLFIGRLSPGKGADILVEAFSSIAGDFPDYQLLIFGNDHGGFQSKVEDTIDAFKIRKAVRIFPPIFGVEKSWAYHAAELIVLPSRYDTMTIIALEAAACGCPVLITDQCDSAVIGDNGGLVVSCDASSLAKGIRDVLGDCNARKKMGSVAKEFVLKTYQWDKISDEFIHLFVKIIDSPSFCL